MYRFRCQRSCTTTAISTEQSASQSIARWMRIARRPTPKPCPESSTRTATGWSCVPRRSGDSRLRRISTDCSICGNGATGKSCARLRLQSGTISIGVISDRAASLADTIAPHLFFDKMNEADKSGIAKFLFRRKAVFERPLNGPAFAPRPVRGLFPCQAFRKKQSLKQKPPCISGNRRYIRETLLKSGYSAVWSSAFDWGSKGREFKSLYPDHFYCLKSTSYANIPLIFFFHGLV